MNRLSRKTKMFYGVAGIGDSALYSMMGMFALFFFTTVAGVDPAVAGTIVAIGAVWDVVSSSIVGYISDKLHTSMGRRKPFVLAASFPLAVFCSLIFLSIDAPQVVKVVYYVFMFIAFWTAYSVFFVPYTAWGAELTDNYEERTELRGIVYVFYSLGGAVGTALPTIIVDQLVQWGAAVKTGWLGAGILVGVLSAAAIFITGWFVNDSSLSHDAGADATPDMRADASSAAAPVTADAESGSPRANSRGLMAVVDIIRNYVQVFRFGPSRYIILTSMFYLVANSIFSADKMYFYTYNMELTAGQISLVILFQNAISVFMVPPLIRINRFLDKRTLCIGGIGMAGACLIIYGFVGIPNIPHLLLFSFFYGIGSICYWQLIPSMLYDVCDADRLENDMDRAGLIISLQGMTESVSGGIGFQILGVLLKFTGFDSTAAVQNHATLSCVHASFTFIPALFAILAMIMMLRYPITRARHTEIIDQLQRR